MWNSVIVQGRQDYKGEHVTGFKLSYTVDGKNWVEYEDGKKFSGNSDGTTKVRHNLTPFYALTVRLTILSFYYSSCTRFGMTFLENS